MCRKAKVAMSVSEAGVVSKHHLLKVKLLWWSWSSRPGRYQSITERQRLIINNNITFTFNTQQSTQIITDIHTSLEASFHVNKGDKNYVI